MQFEGNWNTIQDVIVDKVGKYAYVNGSSHDNTSTPIIMDVSLDIRTKVRPAAYCSKAVLRNVSLSMLCCHSAWPAPWSLCISISISQRGCDQPVTCAPLLVD